MIIPQESSGRQTEVDMPLPQIGPYDELTVEVRLAKALRMGIVTGLSTGMATQRPENGLLGFLGGFIGDLCLRPRIAHHYQQHPHRR